MCMCVLSFCMLCLYAFVCFALVGFSAGAVPRFNYVVFYACQI